MNPSELKKKTLIWTVVSFLMMGLLLFLPAGTVFYWQAWVYMAILFVPMLFAIGYLLKYDPVLLERRLRLKEKLVLQDRLIKWAYLIFGLFLVIPGLDQRYHWSKVAPAVVVPAEILVLAGYILCLWVFKENPYASRIVEVMPEQKVVTTGLYALVRHPMYLGALVMYVFTPLALGSYWALLLIPFLTIFLVLRILDEEKLLLRQLRGYWEYTQKTRYRLIPGIW
ncbi:MAG: isoprenylcysteine carboxylmethyltransferase family protein [Candidatus Omnitrophota bacterium]|nr:MAG: isoprenylcysteine carboxylmethyltransferase family protein [Candidatus Omnitrophota bacterium]